MTSVLLVLLLACKHTAPTPAAVTLVDSTQPTDTSTTAPSSADFAGTVKRTVQRNFGQLTFCYEQSLKKDPNLGGRVETEWVVAGGQVTKASILSNSSGNDEFGECIRGRIERWTFPPEIEGEIVYPFIFKPAG